MKLEAMVWKDSLGMNVVFRALLLKAKWRLVSNAIVLKADIAFVEVYLYSGIGE